MEVGIINVIKINSKDEDAPLVNSSEVYTETDNNSDDNLQYSCLFSEIINWTQNWWRSKNTEYILKYAALMHMQHSLIAINESNF